jgi:NAD(P)-dependent dehydrogenase (short-subunit alcohol dehydrogenase family)
VAAAILAAGKGHYGAAMAGDLVDRVAVVTGAGAGIGRGIALALARAGASVGLLELHQARAQATAAEIDSLGVRAVIVPTDALDSAQVTAGVRSVAEQLGRIDILVNNVGGARPSPFLGQSERSWRRHIDLNLVSMLAATSAAVPVMVQGARGGAILNVASIEARRAAPLYAVYAACKAGMVSFTATMALELADHGIRVNAIAPDKTATPGLRGMTGGAPEESTTSLPDPPAGYREAVARTVPLGREGTIEECGELAVFLCSARASYITGATVPIDGGTAAAGGWIRDGSVGWTLTR